MARIERTIFISYRRKDISWALAVYQYLASKKYDVFFDYTSIPSGDFEQIILSNIRARAHFLIILTPTALDRCNEPGDWLRREIETAIDEKRNIIPLFFDGFTFGLASIQEKLTGKLNAVQRYNGIDIPSGYFPEAMERLRVRYLNAPLDAVLHPIPTEVRKVVMEEQVAADMALLQQKADIDELIKPAKGTNDRSSDFAQRTQKTIFDKKKQRILRIYGMGAAILFTVMLGMLGVNFLIDNLTPTLDPSSTLSLSTISTTPVTEINIRGTAISSKDNMLMMYVPAGEFTMGNAQSSDNPTHKVYLDSFWIDQTEITNEAFASFLNIMGNQVEGSVTWMDIGDEDVHIHLLTDTWHADAGYETHPVVEVSWFGARAYCAWADGRLPTEAEWEKAASWNDLNQEKYTYPWGNEFSCANVNLDDEIQVNSDVVSDGINCDGFNRTSPVGSFPTGISPYGLLDMSGNVWEWMSDWYDATYNIAQELSNPIGSKSGQYRVIRGGSWLVRENEASSVYRYRYDPILPSGNIGFRCVRSE